MLWRALDLSKVGKRPGAWRDGAPPVQADRLRARSFIMFCYVDA